MTEPAPDPEALLYGDERSRLYRAASGGKRCNLLMFAPLHREHDRFLPVADIRMMEVRKDGMELYMEFSDVVVIATGKHLRAVAFAVAAGMCSRVEAFNPRLRDPPQDAAAPFITAIEYYTRTGKKEQTAPEPAAGPKPKIEAR